MSNLTTLKKAARAAIVMLTISAASLSAMPAAQAGGSNPSFNFSFHSGNGIGFSIHDGQYQQRHKRSNRRHHQRRACLSDRQIRHGLSQYGFQQIRLGNGRHGNLRATAVRGRWEYSMVVDRCDGDVSRIRKNRRIARHRNNGGHRSHRQGHSNGLSLQFNFR